MRTPRNQQSIEYNASYYFLMGKIPGPRGKQRSRYIWVNEHMIAATFRMKYLAGKGPELRTQSKGDVRGTHQLNSYMVR